MKFITKNRRLKDLYWKILFKRYGFIKTKFLWLPIEINGDIRWLEYATIKWRIKQDSSLLFDEKYYYWYPHEFIDR